MKQVPDSAVVVIPKPQDSGHASRVPPVTELEFVARLMDSVFQIPGLRVRFGLDSLLGLVPGLGDAVTSVVSLYILQAAQRSGVSRISMTRMAVNTAVDFAVGSIPVVGDIFDVYWKANQSNVELLKRHLNAHPGTERRHQRSDWLFLVGLVTMLLCCLIGSLTMAYFLFTWLAALVSQMMG